MNTRRSLEVLSRSIEVTHRFAAALAPLLRPAGVLFLDGELGAGKTTFVVALARALGSADQVLSPTFTLENRYRVRRPGPAGVTRIVHADLYRPGEDARRDLLPALLEARQEQALLVIEWGEPIKEWLAPYLELSFRLDGPPGARQLSRRLRLGEQPPGWLHFETLAGLWRRIEGGNS